MTGDDSVHIAVMNNNISSRTRVTINVNGRIFETYERTLAYFPDTLLGDPGKRMDYHNAYNDELIFDRDASCFDAILFYYQSKGILARPQNIDRMTFEEELKFFQITTVNDKTHEMMKRLVHFGETPPNGRIREFLWWAFHRPFSSSLATFLALCNILFILTITGISCIDSLPGFNSLAGKSITTHTSVIVKPIIQATAYLKVIETAIMIWLSVEYLVRIYTSSNYVSYFLSPLGLIDLICLVPFFIALVLETYANKQSYYMHIIKMLRFTRSFQLFRLGRYSDGLRALLGTILNGIWHIRSVMVVMPLMIIFFASLILYSEINGSGEKSGNLSDWCWFVLITMTTVGYGDIYPQTIVGRLVAICCALCGVILFCLVTPTILKYFVKMYYLQRSLTNQNSEKNKAFLRRIQEIYYDN